MAWILKERFEKGQWKVPFIGVIAEGNVNGHDVKVAVSNDGLCAYVGDIGVFVRSMSEVMDGLDVSIVDATTTKGGWSKEVQDAIKNGQVPATVDSRPGAGNKAPNKNRNGKVAAAERIIINHLEEHPEGILMVDFGKMHPDISNGSVWKAIMNILKSASCTYEYYQDMDRTHHPKGIRKVKKEVE